MTRKRQGGRGKEWVLEGTLGWIRKWEGRKEGGGEGKEGRLGRGSRVRGALLLSKAPCFVSKSE